MGTAAVWMFWVMLALALLLAGTTEEGVRRRAASLRFEHELRRAWATSRRRTRAVHQPSHVRLVTVEVRRSADRVHDDAA